MLTQTGCRNFEIRPADGGLRLRRSYTRKKAISLHSLAGRRKMKLRAMALRQSVSVALQVRSRVRPTYRFFEIRKSALDYTSLSGRFTTCARVTSA